MKAKIYGAIVRFKAQKSSKVLHSLVKKQLFFMIYDLWVASIHSLYI